MEEGEVVDVDIRTVGRLRVQQNLVLDAKVAEPLVEQPVVRRYVARGAVLLYSNNVPPVIPSTPWPLLFDGRDNTS